MAKLTPLEMAQKLALKGDLEGAVAQLSSIEKGGDIRASASLAEVAAFKGKWPDVLRYAQVVVETPSALETMNVYVDMVNLLALTGIHLGNWLDLKRIAGSALKKLAQREGADEEEGGESAAVRSLAKFASTKGQAGYLWNLAAQDEEPLAKRKVRFESALEKVAKEKKKQFKTPAERRDHLFGLARVLNYHQGAVALSDQEELPDIFDNVVFAASGLARCGRGTEAWQAIRSKLHAWWPVEDSQIAPVELLADEGIRPLMTLKRCEEVLRTPRGPEARVK
jgi:hypothetical protein